MNKLVSLKWLTKAKDDLEWTQANIRESVWYGACFTAQQAAEKALKAYLLYQDKKVPKIHDLGVLLELCLESDSQFMQLKQGCAALKTYYAPARYPDIAEFVTFSKPQALEAEKLAREVIELVERKLS